MLLRSTQHKLEKFVNIHPDNKTAAGKIKFPAGMLWSIGCECHLHTWLSEQTIVTVNHEPEWYLVVDTIIFPHSRHL